MANEIWYSPDAWVEGLIRSKRFNEQISNNLKTLGEKNIKYYQTFTSVETSTILDNADIVHTNTSGIVMAHLKVKAYGATNGVDIWCDIFCELGGGGNFFASTQSSSSAVRGAYNQRQTAAKAESEFNFSIPMAVGAGTHTYHASLIALSGLDILGIGVAQFWIEEYGIAQTNLRKWIEPKNWIAGENLSVNKLDRTIKERMKFLYDRNWVYRLENIAASLTTTSISFEPITSDGAWKLRLLTTGNDVLLSFMCSAFIQTGIGRGWFDFLIDDSIYLSSLTSTPLSDGVFTASYSVNVPRGHYFECLWTKVQPGWHTFEPVFKTSNVANAFTIWLNTPIVFRVEEYCLTA